MNDSCEKPSNNNQDLEVWKYYGSVGGSDKDTMIKIVTWLLGFSTASIGIYATAKLSEPFAKILLIVSGMVISILAAIVALLYGAYAARNWGIADRIADDNNWTKQQPDYEPFKASCLLTLAKPCGNKIAPVFWIFFAFSIFSLCINIALFFHEARYTFEWFSKS
jgi:hypothetical protein